MAEASSAAADEALMLRYQRGDSSAFAFLVRRHKAPLYNFVLRHLRSQAAAEDITQEAFLRVVQRASDFKHEARFSTWLYTIARNLCIDHSRKMKLRRHPSLDAPTETSDGSRTLLEVVPSSSTESDVERAAEWTAMRRSIVAAVEALPDDQREVFLLREVANLPFKEIAEVTGTPENTVKSRMRYALERLRMALSNFEEYARALR
ncbi:MAG TPA: RNA polymerase sigma factor [Polyangiaceae bacterium]|nr:RNA polymerase sigma factor [Polyangiaceae bacterium]